MPYSSGTFSLASGNPVTTGTTISSTWANNTLSDIATGLSTCLLKDGTQTVTANIPMSSFKFTGLAAGSAAGDSVRYEQLFNSGTLALIGSVSVTGSLAMLGSLFVGTTVSASGAFNWNMAATVTATATVAIGAMTGNYAVVTGTATVSSFDSLRAGGIRVIEWSGATPLENNSNIVLPGAANLTTAAGDLTIFVTDGSAVWRAFHQKASGAPISMSPITNSIVADVSCGATGNFAIGPTIAQGTAGTWFASGQVVANSTGGTGTAFAVKLWDGTTVIDSAYVDQTPGSNQAVQIALSGYITNPVGNIRISVASPNSNLAMVRANLSGASKDSTVTAIRIA